MILNKNIVRELSYRSTEGQILVDDLVRRKLEKVGVLQLFELPYFRRPKLLFQWLMSRVHDDYFYFIGRRMRIISHLIGNITGLQVDSEDLDLDMHNDMKIDEMGKKF